MAQQTAFIDDTPAYNPRYADTFVVFAVSILSLAVGVWCLMRLDMTLWVCTVVALAAYTVLLSLHLIVRRSLIATEDAPVEREHSEVWMRGPSSPAPVDTDASEAPAVDAPRSANEEIARWAQAARAEAGSGAPALPQSRAADPFNFRPKQEPSLSPRPSGTAQPEMSVELIQDLIKKLADELNTTTIGERADKPEAANETEAMIGQSVAALQATARTMPGPHASFEAAPAAPSKPDAGVASWWPTAEPAAAAKPGPRPSGMPPALNPRLAPIAEAVAAERMEVLLEPIHALAEGRARHFEVSVRLLTADGEAFEQSELARVVQGSGLMPRVDAARMIRAARVARRLSERGRQGSVLAAVAGESLTDERFLDAATTEPGPEGGMSLVLAFAQSEVRAFTQGHTEALKALAGAGFSFALEEVTDLEMDFAGLKDMGFGFVELDAPVFLEGLPAAGGRVPASDICRHLSDFGLTLIVGHIEDDWLLARILGFGVVFGKGTLFGAPRLVKDEVVANPAAA